MATVLKLPDLDDKLRQVRKERYAAQSVARIALPDERVAKCLRISTNGQVEVWKHLKTDKAFFNGLMVCGRVWQCPVCAAKISERRKEEITKGFEMHKAAGGKIAMLTLTFRHKKLDRLKDILERFNGALAKFRSGKRYQQIRESMGLIGSIRVFEITWGEKNGFHPHVHLALFYTKPIFLHMFETVFKELWVKALQKFGLDGLEDIAVQLQDGSKAEEYISKHGTWSLEQELSKSHIKKGKEGNLTPFDFLREFLLTGESRYIALFKEYAEAMKGKRQIQWSNGLKKQFVIEDKTDEFLASEKTELADLLGLIPYEVWKVILKREIRSNFLDWCEKDGFESALERLKKESSWQEDSRSK